jgi:hypothetical protein
VAAKQYRISVTEKKGIVYENLKIVVL